MKGGQRPEVIEAVVKDVHAGEGGYVSTSLRSTIADAPKGTHITFSLSDWQGTEDPRTKQVVVLEQITKFEKGWRALSARPIQLGS